MNMNVHLTCLVVLIGALIQCNAFLTTRNTKSITEDLSDNSLSSKTPELELTTKEALEVNSEIKPNLDLNEDMNTAESSIVFRPLFAYRRKQEKEEKRRRDKTTTPPKVSNHNVHNHREQKVYYYAYPYYYYPDYSNYYSPPGNNYYPSQYYQNPYYQSPY